MTKKRAYISEESDKKIKQLKLEYQRDTKKKISYFDILEKIVSKSKLSTIK